MSADLEVTWTARDKNAQELVEACARGELPFSGPNSLFTEFNSRGWSTRYLYEAVRNAEVNLGLAMKVKRQ